MKTGVVMPVGKGRLENVLAVTRSLAEQTAPIEATVYVLDGHDDAEMDEAIDKIASCVPDAPFPFSVTRTPKHEPGVEQPRNVGVRVLELEHDCDHVWFVDSDVILDPQAHEHFRHAHAGVDRILIGPYDWLPQGVRQPLLSLRNDPRWVSFDQYDGRYLLVEDLSAGLACFSGNLIWPIERFVEVGGFWSEIHHGRCEDGELGLRAVALGVPISYVREARGWHLWHPVNVQLAQERNARDVPMINERHPWVQGEGLHVVPVDGRRFNVRCKICEESINTLDWWNHAGRCGR